MKLFIAGIGGTLMAGVAQLARAAGHQVDGCDNPLYPPVSTLLAESGITWREGYDPAHLSPAPDCVLFGNALSRGNPLVEAVLDRRIPYASAPAWLGQHILRNRRVLAVAGTHGKTTTSSMLAWILQASGLEPGFLIGGRPGNFSQSARLGTGEYFVIEADEYDTAFFDKRAKFVHYAPSLAILHNLEFDHADIYPNRRAIERQFAHLLRTMPASATVLVNQSEPALRAVLRQGCWSRTVGYTPRPRRNAWGLKPLSEDYQTFQINCPNNRNVRVQWQAFGRHNAANALAAVAGACECGIDPAAASEALRHFIPAARRLQPLHADDRHQLYSDFAHHPSAIAAVLEALRTRHPGKRLVAGLDLASNSMRAGVHGPQVDAALDAADAALLYTRHGAAQAAQSRHATAANAKAFIHQLTKLAGDSAVIVLMSNGGFDGIPAQVVKWFGGAES